jgi:hypothetical protein
MHSFAGGLALRPAWNKPYLNHRPDLGPRLITMSLWFSGMTVKNVNGLASPLVVEIRR